MSWKDDASFTTLADCFETVFFWGAFDMADMDSGHAMCQFVMSMTTTCDDEVQTMSVMDVTLLEADVCRTDFMEVGSDYIVDGDVCKLAHSSEGKALYKVATFAGAQYSFTYTSCRDSSSACLYVYTSLKLLIYGAGALSCRTLQPLS